MNIKKWLAKALHKELLPYVDDGFKVVTLVARSAFKDHTIIDEKFIIDAKTGQLKDSLQRQLDQHIKVFVEPSQPHTMTRRIECEIKIVIPKTS